MDTQAIDEVTVEPGIYHGMPFAEYRETPGLSNSAMKDLAVSPLRYWHLHVNPNRPADRETPEMQFGTALHCAVLEPDSFETRFCREIDPDEYPGILVTIDDMRQWLRDKGHTPKGTRKSEVIAQVQTHDPTAPILDVLQRWHEQANQGKTELSVYDWRRAQNAALALHREPVVQKILENGQSEVSVFAADPDSGVMLKGRMDWVTPEIIFDPKTFTQKRGKSIDKSVADAIFYEDYHRQGCMYSKLDALATGKPPRRFILGFVESEEPHEVRIRELVPKVGGEPNLYWMRALLEIRGLIRTYDECWTQFGSDPWRVDRDADPLIDAEIPQLAY